MAAHEAFESVVEISLLASWSQITIGGLMGSTIIVECSLMIEQQPVWLLL